MKCPNCEKEVLGRPTTCDGCGYRFTRNDFEKIKSGSVEEKGVSEHAVCIINGVLAAINMLILLFPIVSGYGTNYNIFSLFGNISKYGGSFISVGVNITYFLMVIMFVLETVFIIFAFMCKRASGGVGIAASAVTFLLLNSIKVTLSESSVTIVAHLMIIIPIVTFVLSIVTLAARKKN